MWVRMYIPASDDEASEPDRFLWLQLTYLTFQFQKYVQTRKKQL